MEKCQNPDPCPGCGNCLLCDGKCTCKVGAAYQMYVDTLMATEEGPPMLHGTPGALQAWIKLSKVTGSDFRVRIGSTGLYLTIEEYLKEEC